VGPQLTDLGKLLKKGVRPGKTPLTGISRGLTTSVAGCTRFQYVCSGLMRDTVFREVI
jgi:hypothetical protein